MQDKNTPIFPDCSCGKYSNCLVFWLNLLYMRVIFIRCWNCKQHIFVLANLIRLLKLLEKKKISKTTPVVKTGENKNTIYSGKAHIWMNVKKKINNDNLLLNDGYLSYIPNHQISSHHQHVLQNIFPRLYRDKNILSKTSRN